MKIPLHLLLLGAALPLGAVLSGCGEDGKGVPDDGTCQELKQLYRYEYFDGGDGTGKPAWIPVHADGSRLTQAELDIITANTSPSPVTGRRCQTPPGAAKTLDAG